MSVRSSGTGTRPRRASRPAEASPTTSALPGGRFGAFRFIERIERGGPAELYRALWSEAPSAAERICLIKRLRPELASSPAFVRMFQQEARAMALLDHPNVARVFAHGEIEGLPYLAMEPLEGLPLAQLLVDWRTSGKRLPVEVACYLAGEVAAALAHAHAATDMIDGQPQPLGLVHRDVRPGNVLLLPSGAVKLIEFGVARVASFVSQSLNASGAGAGKSSYVSPEQLAGAPLDARSDLFSLGVVLWELLCGQALFPPTEPGEAVARLTGGALPRPSSVRAEVPPALDQLVMRLLEREPPARHPSARQLVRDLEAFVPARNDAQRAVASMVNVGPEADDDQAAALADAVAAASAERAAGRRPVTRVAGNVAANVAVMLAMRQFAGRIPGSVRRISGPVRKITGLVPVVASRLLRRTPARPVPPKLAPPTPSPPDVPPIPLASSIDAATTAGLSPIPAFLIARLRSLPRRPARLARAAAIPVLGFLAGVAWHHASAPSAAVPPPTTAARLAGVQIQSLPTRPPPPSIETPVTVSAHQGQGTAASTGEHRVIRGGAGGGKALRGKGIALRREGLRRKR